VTTPTRVLAHAPPPIRRWALYFECLIEDSVARFAADLPSGARLLDAGAGEGQYRQHFTRQRYTGVDLGVGDAGWNYSKLEALADLNSLPFPEATFDAAINVVTLEHLRDPQIAVTEIARILKPGAPFLLVAPLEWEEHQQPNDFFRYTRFGLQLLLERAGFDRITLTPAGGYFRLLSRRLLNGLQFFMKGPRWLGFVPAALVFVPLSLVMPLFEPLDREQNFTLGYICTARKRFS
jgi:SAM-dependent methyltransferase